MATDGALAELTLKQRRAVCALLEQKTVTLAAEAAGVGRRTLDRWLHDDGFRAALDAAQAALFEQTLRRLLAANAAAVGALERTLDDPLAPAGAKIRAALAILDLSLRLREFLTLERRLAQLEARIENELQPASD